MINRSYCTLRAQDFKVDSYKELALARLAKSQSVSFSIEESQLYAWEEEIDILRPIALAYPNATFSLEYMIPRMGKRVDAVVLVDNYIFVIEFKIGERTYPWAAIDQVSDYAFDLRNFHKESHRRTLFPILVCTRAIATSNTISQVDDGIYDVQLSNGSDLLRIIENTMQQEKIENDTLNHDIWLNSLYSPTPTIIEAAQALYQKHAVEDISRNAAGLTNISTTTECINGIIERSKNNRRKAICFVTGVPGAGKTLVGLNLASLRRSENGRTGEETAVFLSGNGPLISVLQASLVEDQQARNAEQCAACRASRSTPECIGCSCKKPKSKIKAEVESFVQGVHHFREELFITEEPPPEHIAIFDESQRAWTEEWLSYQMRTRRQNKREVNKSEPQCLIEYMDRHEDWACMVCLVGGGQEINKGEAGIIEWFKALNTYFPEWDIYVSDAINSENYLGAVRLDIIAPRATVIDELHLAVDMRSFRNKHVAAFAEALVSNRPSEAKNLYGEIKGDYPIYVTRDLALAKDWVRKATKRPSDRYGIVADSYGQRIRADGVIVPMDFDAVKWFLRGKDEVDSSYFMEIAASEFKIQGLEIDYAVIAWEGDYRYRDGRFEHHRFYGGKWQNVNSEMLQRYLKNGYRVLLTRARQGFVIYVPRGSRYDPTRKPEFYDETYEYLLASGIQELDQR